MADIAAMGATTYRDYETDGVPSSGIRRPPKSEVRDLFSAVADEIQTAKDSANLSFQGAWDSGTTYQIGMSVSYSGSSYASRIADNVGNQPDISPTQWQVLGLQGAAGSTGPAGADGQLVVDRWVASVFANSGSVSANERNARRDFYQALAQAGIYDKLDDFALLAGENSTQALVTGKRRTLMTGMNAPVFTRRGVQFVAASSQYIKTGFVPSTHASQMDGSHIEVGVYSMGNVHGTTSAVGCYNGSNQRIEVTPSTGGSAYFHGLNAPPSTFGASSDPTGLVSAYRNGSTYGATKNGAAGGPTYSPGTNGTALPTVELYIGGRNNAGTADQLYTGVISFVCWGAVLSDAQRLALYNAVQAYLVATASLDTYVSATSGNNANAGDVNHPYANWNTGYANTQAGATMWLDGTPGSPQAYKDTVSANTAITKAITVRAINTGGAQITSNGATNNALYIGPTAGETINLIGVVIDPSLNASASSLVYTLSLSSQSTAYRLTCTDCTFKGWTGAASSYGVYATSANFKAYLRFERCSFIGDTVFGAITIPQIAQGSVDIVACSFALTNQNSASFGPASVKATGAGVTASATDCTGSTTIKSSLTGTSQHNFFYFENLVGYIARNNVSHLGPGSPRLASLYRISTNGAGDSTEYPISGSIIEDNTGYVEPSGGGIAQGFGIDGIAGDKSKAVGCISRRNTIRASAAWGAAGGHGDFAGCCRNYQSYGNKVYAGGINYVRKNLDGTLDEHDNLGVGATSSSYLYKSVVPTGGNCRDNRAVLTTASPGATAISLTQDAADSGPYTSGITIDSYEVLVNGAAGAILVNIETGSDGTFAGNLYLLNAGTLASTKFKRGATNDTTFSAWHAAKGTTDAANFA